MTQLELVEFPVTSLWDISAKLRVIADQIDAGDYGECTSCAVVLRGAKGLDVFGFGKEGDGTVVHYLLACAQRKMEAPMLGE